MKQKYRLSDEELNQVLNASKPVTYIVIGGIPPSSPQENANAVWKSLASKHSFVWDSCEDAGTGDQHDFLAEPLR